MKFFISYAHSDKEAMNKLSDELTKRLSSLLSVEAPSEFVDAASEMLPGDNIRQKIRAQVDECNYFIVLWTPRAAASDWVQYELAMADALKKRIVVVKEEGAPEVPPVLQGREVIEVKETG